MHTTALIIAIILFILGVAGTVLPALPGPILVFGGMLIYGIMTDFANLGLSFFVAQMLVLGIIFAADYLSSAIGTKLSGGSKQAALGAIIGTIIAIIIIGPLGLIVGPFLGAVTVELIRGIKPGQAFRIGLGTLIGTLGGTLFKLSAVVVMIVYFFFKIF